MFSAQQQRSYFNESSQSLANHLALLQKPMPDQSDWDGGVLVVLGSGFAPLPEALGASLICRYNEIDHFHNSTAPGHPGRLFHGRVSGRSVWFMQGRLHYYEGLDIQQVVYPLQFFLYQGIRHVFLFNAAGSINQTYEPGDWMIIRDHINLFGDNPLRGPNMDHLGPRFAPMEGVYDSALRENARQFPTSKEQKLHQGVYVAVPGPSYETAAEIRMLQLLGADAVGMSTVPEAIAAYHAGARIFAMSVISNWGSGLRPEQKQIQADHVTATVASSIDHLPQLVQHLVQNL